MVKKGQLEVSKMDADKQGEPRDPNGPMPNSQHSSGHAGTASEKRSAGSRSQSRSRPGSEGSEG